jgi:hypothetical protein
MSADVAFVAFLGLGVLIFACGFALGHHAGWRARNR